jgi:hypothetical protein
MPEIKVELKKQALKRAELVNMKTHRLGRDREAKDTITKRLNMKILSDTTDHRLQKSSYCGIRQSELTVAKGDDQEEFTRGEAGLKLTGRPNWRRILASTTLPGLVLRPGRAILARMKRPQQRLS